MTRLMVSVAALALGLGSLLSTVATAHADAVPVNLFTNGSFESTNPAFDWVTNPDFVNRMTGWTANSDGCESAAWLPVTGRNLLEWEYRRGVWLYEFPPHSGAAAWLNQCGGTTDPWIRQTVTVQAGRTYLVTGYVRTGVISATPIFESFRVCVDDCLGANNLTVSIPGAAVNVWLPFTAEFTATSNSATITFVGEVVTDSDYLIDDVAIVDAASASSAGGADNAPAPVLQQFGKPASGTCDAAAPASLNWSGVASGGWGESWAEWVNDGRGGAVCSRVLVFSRTQGRWIIG